MYSYEFVCVCVCVFEYIIAMKIIVCSIALAGVPSQRAVGYSCNMPLYIFVSALFICLRHQRFSTFAQQITNNESIKLSHATFNVNQPHHTSCHCLLFLQQQRSNLPKSFAKTATNRKLISLLSNFTLLNGFYFIYY